MNPQGEPGEDMLRQAESLDSDEVRNRDGDVVVDPPEDWTGADRFGMTSREQREGQPLGERLAQEEPDIGAGRPEREERGTGVEGLDAVRPDTRGHEAAPTHRHAGQIDGTPEDGDSFYPIEE
ncbi:hypothetical protein NDR87_02685 [Nocardia sp. CDC159]|uniref:DUF5709 domain-containing protein n=1 Tax=Nocardia pulmonis TaxID=2951408 RepID=A0A9X2E5N8_9NOCA|nr:MULTISPECIES: hypothetical protein [Nocardia]MCM6772081.1 hypothetical protein [Nocardia pulmonis]MCM6785261.1 hypothetical protein [Nocardia sp. CDC159]